MKNREGFTLIEVMVVIAIIGLLSSIILASLSVARARAQKTRFVAEIKSVQNALELYRTNNGKYPHETTNENAATDCSNAYDCFNDNANGGVNTNGSFYNLSVLVPTYISSLPTRPNANYFMGYYTLPANYADSILSQHLTCNGRSDYKYILYFNADGQSLSFPVLKVKNSSTEQAFYDNATYCVGL